MTITPGNLDVQVSATALPILSPSQSVVFLKVTAANTDTASHTLEVWRVASGGSPSASNVMIPLVTLATNQTVTLPLSGQSLIYGQSLYAKADAASKVNLNIGYVTQS